MLSFIRKHAVAVHDAQWTQTLAGRQLPVARIFFKGIERMSKRKQRSTLPRVGNASYDRYIRYFNQWMRRNGFSRISPERVFTFLQVGIHEEAERVERLKGGTVNIAKMALIQSIDIWCNQSRDYTMRERYHQRAFRRIKPNKDSPKRQILTREEYLNFLAALSKKNRAICTTMYVTGGRIGEVLAIAAGPPGIEIVSVDGLKFARAYVPGKKRNEIDLDIPLRLYKALHAYFKPIERIFESMAARNVQDSFRRASRRVLGRNVWPHLIRHTAATHLYERTGNLRMVQNFLHHENISTTADIYIAERDTAADIIRILEGKN